MEAPQLSGKAMFVVTQAASALRRAQLTESVAVVGVERNDDRSLPFEDADASVGAPELPFGATVLLTGPVDDSASQGIAGVGRETDSPAGLEFERDFPGDDEEALLEVLPI
jgi:hypothetical protein